MPDRRLRLALLGAGAAITFWAARAAADESRDPVPVGASTSPTPTDAELDRLIAGDPEHVSRAARATRRAGDYSFSAKLSTGGALRQLYTVPIFGWLSTLQIGGRGKGASGHLTLSAMLGQTEWGLRVYSYHVGGLVEWPHGRFRLGLGGKVGSFNIVRATHQRHMPDLSLAVQLVTTFDLWQADNDEGAFYVELAGELDILPSQGLNLLLGYRWP